MTGDEAVDEGLCWGWVSGHRKALDDTYFLQRYTPRPQRSNWSAVNVAKVAALTAAGRMRPAGQAEVAAALADVARVPAWSAELWARRAPRGDGRAAQPPLPAPYWS